MENEKRVRDFPVVTIHLLPMTEKRKWARFNSLSDLLSKAIAVLSNEIMLLTDYAHKRT
jgi:hypothetical protein